MQNDNDTIFALASAPGRAGIAVMRVSGPNAALAMEKMCEPASLLKPRTTSLRHIVNPFSQEPIDKAVVIWSPAPASYTGEDVLEFHLHGGRAILNDVTESLRALPCFRVAEPGEFTRRAFENGKLDLTEAEAVADLVDAETAAQRRQALRQLEGGLGRMYHAWADLLKRQLAFVEADIDFVEDDLPEDIVTKNNESLRILANEIEAHLNDSHRGERLREGFVVAILGPPNAGKSSLLNALTQRDAAIVTPIPGTTRDIIEVRLDLGGYPVALTDTAGLRETADLVESEGVRRAIAQAAQADFKILLFDGAQWPHVDPTTLNLKDDDALLIVNKADLINPPPDNAQVKNAPVSFISVASGKGVSELTDTLVKAIEKRFASTGQPSLTRARHRTALEKCRDGLRRALDVQEAELRAEEMRMAMQALGRITGRVDVEDLLDIIFKDFCIGK